MSATLLNDETLNERETLTVVVLYDDRASRDHVLRIRDHLVENFGGELEVVCSWWKFDFLADSSFAVAAAREVDKADVILFSIHSAATLPAHVKGWVDRTLSRGRKSHCLLALLGAEDNENEIQDIDDFLTTVAVRAGVDYLGVAALGGVPSELARRSLAHRAFTRTTVMDDILSQRPYVDRPRWGINE